MLVRTKLHGLEFVPINRNYTIIRESTLKVEYKDNSRTNRAYKRFAAIFFSHFFSCWYRDKKTTLKRSLESRHNNSTYIQYTSIGFLWPLVHCPRLTLRTNTFTYSYLHVWQSSGSAKIFVCFPFEHFQESSAKNFQHFVTTKVWSLISYHAQIFFSFF